MSTENADSECLDRPLQSVRFVGPATAATLRQAGYDATAITDKRVSYRRLVDAGVNPGVAAKIRREHSLSWSFRSGGDLGRRSAQVRGLGSAEAAWVAASAGDWESASEPSTDELTDESAADETPARTPSTTDEPTPWPTHGQTTETQREAVSAEAAWRARSTPTPVGELKAIDDETVDLLAEAGISSVRQLAAIDSERVADVLELPSTVVEEWSQAARAAAQS